MTGSECDVIPNSRFEQRLVGVPMVERWGLFGDSAFGPETARRSILRKVSHNSSRAGAFIVGHMDITMSHMMEQRMIRVLT